MFALVNIAKCKKDHDGTDVCLIKMVMPYVNILKYLEHICNKQLQNGIVSGNVNIVRVIAILKKCMMDKNSL